MTENKNSKYPHIPKPDYDKVKTQKKNSIPHIPPPDYDSDKPNAKQPFNVETARKFANAHFRSEGRPEMNVQTGKMPEANIQTPSPTPKNTKKTVTWKER